MGPEEGSAYDREMAAMAAGASPGIVRTKPLPDDTGRTQRLIEAAREILTYVEDPDALRPVPQRTITLFQRPKTLLQQAREKANKLEAQSRAVRRLREAIEEWSR